MTINLSAMLLTLCALIYFLRTAVVGYVWEPLVYVYALWVAGQIIVSLLRRMYGSLMLSMLSGFILAFCFWAATVHGKIHALAGNTVLSKAVIITTGASVVFSVMPLLLLSTIAGIALYKSKVPIKQLFHPATASKRPDPKADAKEVLYPPVRVCANAETTSKSSERG